MKITIPSLLLLVALSFITCATLPAAPATALVERAAPDVPIEVCWVETAGTHASGHFAAAGWTRSPKWDVTASVLVVRHPRGDVLIDSGTSSEPGHDADELGVWKRFVL